MSNPRTGPARPAIFPVAHPLPRSPRFPTAVPVLQRQVQPGAGKAGAVAAPAAFKAPQATLRPPPPPVAQRSLGRPGLGAAPRPIQAMWAQIAAAPAPAAPAAVAAPIVAAVAAVPAAATLTASYAARSHFNDLRANPDGLPTTLAALRQYVVNHWGDFDPDGDNYKLELGYQSTRTFGGGTAERMWSIIIDDHHIFHYGPSGG